MTAAPPLDDFDAFCRWLYMIVDRGQLYDAFRALAQSGGEDTKRLDWLNDQPPPTHIKIARDFRDADTREDADIRECIDTMMWPAAAEPARPSDAGLFAGGSSAARQDSRGSDPGSDSGGRASPPSAAPSADRYDKDWSEHEGQLAPTEVVAHRPEPPELTPAHREELTKLHRVADNSPSCNWCRMPYPCDTTRLLAQVSALEQRLLRPTTEPPELELELRELVARLIEARDVSDTDMETAGRAIERLGRERAGALDEAAHWKRCWDAECVRLREANERAERAAPLMFLLREQDTGPSAAASALSELQKGSIIDMLLNTFDEVRQLRADRAALVKTLESISRWDMPPTRDGKPYVYHWGSSGERDVIVQRARVALTALLAEPVESEDKKSPTERAKYVRILADARPVVANAANDPNASPWQREIRIKILSDIDAALDAEQ